MLRRTLPMHERMRRALLVLLLAGGSPHAEDHPEFWTHGLQPGAKPWTDPARKARAGAAASAGKATTLALGVDVNLGHSGSWFEPATSGQGLVFEVIPSTRSFVLYWFTHAAIHEADDRQAQRWLVGVGQYAQDRADLTLYLSRGGRFARPPVVDAVEVGAASVQFASCERATLRYAVREHAIRGLPMADAGPMIDGEMLLQRLGADALCAAFERPVADQAVAFVGANVLSMDSAQALTNQVVVVRHGAIAEIGTVGTVGIPADATIVAALGRWLAPGLVDFHVHEQPFSDWPDDIGGNFIMYLANGVTSIVSMGEFSGRMLAIGRRVRSGELPGPEVHAGLFARSPAEGGNAQTIAGTPAAARALVQNGKHWGYDFIKSYDGLSIPVFEALTTEASAQGLAVLGHTNAQLPLAGALQRGQRMVVHAVSILGTHFGGATNAALIPGMVQSIQAAQAVISPTLWVSSVITEIGLAARGGDDPLRVVYGQEGTEFMDDGALVAWEGMLASRPDVTAPVDRRPALAFMRQMTSALDQGGVPLLAGTDVIGIPGVVPGFSMHGEMAMLRQAGLSPHATLDAATRAAGRFIRDTMRPGARFGTVTVGARADLVLLDTNPLVEADTWRRPVGVMAAGRWYPGAWLRRELERLRTSR